MNSVLNFAAKTDVLITKTSKPRQKKILN